MRLVVFQASMYFSMQEDRQEDSLREREVDCEVGVMQWLKQFLWEEGMGQARDDGGGTRE